MMKGRILVLLCVLFFGFHSMLFGQNKDVLKWDPKKLRIKILAVDSIKRYVEKVDGNLKGIRVEISEILNVSKMYVDGKRDLKFEPKLKLLGASEDGALFYVDYERAYYIEVKADNYEKWSQILMAYVPKDLDENGKPYPRPGYYGYKARMIPSGYMQDSSFYVDRIAFYSKDMKRFTMRETKVTINTPKLRKVLTKEQKAERELLSKAIKSGEDKKTLSTRPVSRLNNGSSIELFDRDSINIIDLQRKKQGKWVHFGEESGDSAYDLGSKWYEGYYKNDQKSGDWIKYFPDQDTSAILKLDENLLVGNFKFFNENGNVKDEGVWDFNLNGLKGKYLEYDDDGGVMKEFYYDNNSQRQGRQIVYYSSGNYAVVSNMTDDVLDGYTNYYYEDGKLYLQQLYKEGKMISEKYFGDPKKFPQELKSAFKKVQMKNDSSVEARINSVMEDLSMIDTNYRILLEKRERQLKEKDLLLSQKERENQLMKNQLSKSDLMNQLQSSELNRQKTLLYGASAALFLVILLMLLAVRGNQQKKKSNILLSAEKEKVENQKMQIETSHKEIQDSIKYARRIQEAILPPVKLVKEHLTESFILYKPKDIVAGDFYWFEAKDDDVYFAAADCTGHGVPGAMVSVVCANALNRAVNEMKIIEPARILDKVRELVVETFHKSEEEVKDGMDISFCKLNLKSRKLIYAGAHNPLYRITPISGEVEDKVLKNDECMLLEYKGDKQPIGKWAFEKPFEQQEIQLLKGDTIYISTDGYADQFGGENGKKFMYKAFKKLFLSVQQEEMEKQKAIIDESFVKWMNGHEQVDDVCVIGVRV